MRQSKSERYNKDVIVYCAMDSGIDGREQPRVVYASLLESALDAMIAADPNRAWRTKTKKIVNLACLKIMSLKKLDGVERLALEIA